MPQHYAIRLNIKLILLCILLITTHSYQLFNKYYLSSFVQHTSLYLETGNTSHNKTEKNDDAPSNIILFHLISLVPFQNLIVCIFIGIGINSFFFSIDLHVLLLS